VRDYVPLGELEVGTVLHVQGGGEGILVSKTWRQGDFEVFDFEVEGLHNFYVRGEGSEAAGVLVHNSTGAEVASEMVGNLPKPPRGKGSVPKAERDPQRTFSPSQRDAKRTEQGGECATGCGTQIDRSNSQGHHVERHADGGPTTSDNHAEVCIDCHKKLHAP